MAMREDQDTVGAAAFFRSLGDPSRLAILQHLGLGEHNVAELTEHLGLAQSTVSKHLASLREQGLVASRAEGRSSVFSLTDAEPLAALFSAAERVRQG
ncbi:ArsR/SmtB family transcription factor [Microbacterium indicum]|uniref:ArsR/SmtB family transcription factor n=1 Tax=Microbacterium indicum TaxID=358100 RepID=UPI000422B428|nr:metalloregulator ArsR/SmtB family transcription factor [Microbacterium indicum]